LVSADSHAPVPVEGNMKGWPLVDWNRYLTSSKMGMRNLSKPASRWFSDGRFCAPSPATNTSQTKGRREGF
jgi:hypothetical protein